MAGFTGIIKTLADLIAQTTAADTDVMIIGTTSPKKITIANLKEALGINALNRNITDLANLSNMKMVWVNQSGTYTFPLPIGKMAIVCTYNGIYPHYSGSGSISANQLVTKGTETVITSVNNTARTVSVYNNAGGATQAVILMPI